MGININLSKDPSKQEEIECLEKIAKYFKEHRNNYLYDLFSPELIGAASGMIRNDFPADVLGNAEERERKNRIAYDELKKEANKIDQERINAEEDLYKLTLELSKTANELKTAINQKNYNQERLVIRNAAENKALHKNWELEREIKRLENELLKQKARNAGLRVSA